MCVNAGRGCWIDPLGVELQVVVSHLIWTLETEPWSSKRAASASNHSLAPQESFYWVVCCFSAESSVFWPIMRKIH